MTRVNEVFPNAKHRECMWHLVQNFKKRYSGKVFDEHLWASAYSWNLYMFEKHIQAMAAANPAAILSHPILQSKTKYSYMCVQDVQHTHISQIAVVSK